ncbi:protein new-glue 1-like [Drosophila eugracilis]|uniref:protein new-glue 1-like n=1 Tax=Drosophila eugracilis TaxID=29029 RepID=UPI001BD9A434|nr:protein new-glue 1-like [Drosophila eugracilis]XP_041674236.1 protein new-glue 1-like [Drosophila eugracilis]
MKFLFVVALIALAIQVAYSASTTTTTTDATTTTTTTTAATTTTTASSTHKKRCWKGNNWCHTRIPKRKCKHPKRCHKTVVIVTRRKN